MRNGEASGGGIIPTLRRGSRAGPDQVQEVGDAGV